MVIALAHLPPVALAQLRRALPAPHRIVVAESWPALLALVSDRACDVVVVDPCSSSERCPPERVRSLARAAGTVPIVGYVSVTAAAIRAVQRLVQGGAAEIVIRGIDDAGEQLGNTLARVLAAAGAQRVTALLAPVLARVPVGLADAIETVFASPDRTRSVSDLARAAGMTRRTLDRWLARAGLCSARTLLACARANAAYRLLASGERPRDHVVALAGYTSVRALARELRWVTGQRSARSVHGLSPQVFERIVRGQLLRERIGLALTRAGTAS